MHYSTKTIEPNMVKALLVDAPISTKASIEISNQIRGKTIEKARTILELSVDMKRPIPYKRFTNGPGHKRGKGVASGRFAVKACQQFLGLLASVESNARDKGINTNGLVIKTLIVQKASRPYHYGRQSRIKMKRSHVELIVEEAKKSEQKSKDIPSSTREQSKNKKETKKEPKSAPKPTEKKSEQKSETLPSSEGDQTKESKALENKPVTKTEVKKVKKEPENKPAPKVTEKMLKG